MKIIIPLLLVVCLLAGAANTDLHDLAIRMEQEQRTALNCGLTQEELLAAAKSEMERKGIDSGTFAVASQRMKALAEALRQVVLEGADPEKMYQERKLDELGYTKGNWAFYTGSYKTEEKILRLEAMIPDSDDKIAGQLADQFRPVLERLLLNSRILCEFDRLNPDQKSLPAYEKLSAWWQGKVQGQGLSDEDAAALVQMLSAASSLPKSDQKHWNEFFRDKISGQNGGNAPATPDKQAMSFQSNFSADDDRQWGGTVDMLDWNEFYNRMKEDIRGKIEKQIDFAAWENVQETKSKVETLTVDDKLMSKIAHDYSIVRVSQSNWDVHFTFVLGKGKSAAGQMIHIGVFPTDAKARNTVMQWLYANLSSRTRGFESCEPIPDDSPSHAGDFCAYSHDDFYFFTRSNVGVIVFARFKKLEDVLPLVKCLDEHIQASLVDTDGREIAEPRLVFESSRIMAPSRNDTRPQRKKERSEELEQELKALSPEEAGRRCQEKALELSESPDANAKELMFYLRGLPMPDDRDGTAKALHRVMDNAKDVKLLSLAVEMQGKWLARFAEPRTRMQDDVGRALASGDGGLRKRALAALGRSRSLDALPLLLRELEAAPDDLDVLAAVAAALGATDAAPPDDGSRAELEKAAAAFLEALSALRQAAGAHGGAAE